jgi:hypothetical protein
VAGYVVERAITEDPMLTATGQGGRLALQLRPHAAASLRASLLALDRVYDLGRRDVHVRADAALFVDLARNYGFVVGGTFLRNTSTNGDFDYTKWTAYAGIVIGASH